MRLTDYAIQSQAMTEKVRPAVSQLQFAA